MMRASTYSALSRDRAHGGGDHEDVRGHRVAIAGFVAGALLAWTGVELFSSNRHDRSLEAAMTAFFIAGPFRAVPGGIAGWRLVRRGRRRAGG